MSAIKTDDFDYALKCIGCGEGQTLVLGGRCIECHGEHQRAEGVAEGERRATARVVAWLRERAIEESSSAPNYIDDLADAIERGEHEEKP